MRMTRSWTRLILMAAVSYASVGGVRVASAAIRVNDFEVSFFGRTWHVASYFVQDDLLLGPQDDTFLEPEGLAIRNGVLYASGDREDDETYSRLAVYNCPPSGTLSFDHAIQMPSVSPSWWGPEGLTFNPSGVGYGGGPDELVTVERDTPAQAGVVNLATGAVSNKLATDALEDVTFLPNRSQFAVLTDLGTSIRLTFYNLSMVPTGEFFAVLQGSNGLAALSASFGSWLTRTTRPDESVVVVTKAAPGNAVLAYDLAGNRIGGVYKLPAEPKARIPLGGGFYELKPAFGTVEAVTIDEANHLLILGDELNSMIHVLTGGRIAVDFDADGDVDLTDFIRFQGCFNGPNQPPALTGCGAADSDGDGDVDMTDSADFQTCFSGAGQSPACE